MTTLSLSQPHRRPIARAIRRRLRFWLVRGLAARRAYLRMQALDDHFLADLGVGRSELERVLYA